MKLDDQILEQIAGFYDIPRESFKTVDSSSELRECYLGAQPALLRISNYKTVGEQTAEAEWINFLARNGVGVARVLPLRIFPL